jgi:hypothetical protein
MASHGDRLHRLTLKAGRNGGHRAGRVRVDALFDFDFGNQLRIILLGYWAYQGERIEGGAEWIPDAR